MIEIDSEAVARVKRAHPSNPTLRNIGVDAPIGALVRSGERRAHDPLTDAHVVEFAGLCGQASFDVAQARIL